MAYFDVGTVLLYVIVGLLGVLFIEKMMTCQNNPLNELVYRYKHNVSTAPFFFVVIYTFLAVFRSVSPNIGGSDALTYVLNFQTSLSNNGGYIKVMNGKDLEAGFTIITKAIRFLTSSYHIYYLIVYTFISYFYVKFIRDICPKGLFYIPFILLMYPYLRSFNTIRSSVAVGFIIWGLTIMNKKKWLSLLILIVSVSFHRMSILYVMIWPFYYLLRNYFYKLKKYQFVLFSMAGMIVIYLLSMTLQLYIGASMEIDELDMYYTTRSIGENHFERYPLVLGHLLTFGAIIWSYNKIKWEQKSTYLRTLFIYDLWVLPAGVVLGAWRFVEYLYLVRLSLWCIILYSISKGKSPSSVKTINILSLLVFGAWLVFRIYKEWDPIKISPYILDIGL